MGEDKIRNLIDKQREKSANPIRDAIRRAQQHVRRVGADELQEPEGLASGDVNKFLENPDGYERDDDADERGGTRFLKRVYPIKRR
ncbi:MAG TPA: hypothetical protein VGD45_02550 [Steroidobacter sp.]|uniref:hypothetical protein n=1 Tax=Steroidobacter sp. TaxID=1978227 RepID=UPI002EDA2BBC